MQMSSCQLFSTLDEQWLFITGFTQFLARDVQDTFTQLMDNGLRMLLQLITSWKNALGPKDRQPKDPEVVRTSVTPRRTDHALVSAENKHFIVSTIINFNNLIIYNNLSLLKSFKIFTV